MTNVSYSEDEGHDNHEHDIDIESQEDPNPSTIPNQTLKWAQNLIEAARNIARDPDNRRRTRSQYQNEHIAPSHSDPLLLERCFMMMGSDPH